MKTVLAHVFSLSVGALRPVEVQSLVAFTQELGPLTQSNAEQKRRLAKWPNAQKMSPWQGKPSASNFRQ